MSFEECSTSRSMAENGSVTCIHKCSKRFPDKSKFKEDRLDASQGVKLDKGQVKNCKIAKNNQLPNAQIQISLKEQATELIREIAVLDYEVSHLEQYLLSFYRKAFEQTLKSSLVTTRGKFIETSSEDISLQANDNGRFKETETDEVLNSGLLHCHSSVQRTSPPEILGKSLRPCQSQPPSMMEYAQKSSIITSLAEHLSTKITDHVPETPNKISEDMVKCMCAIYCGLSSPTLSLSSTNTFSPKNHLDMMWGPGFRRDSSWFDVQLDNPFHVQGFKEFNGPYSTMVEIKCLYKTDKKVGEIQHMLQHFRSLVSRLKDVNPKKLEHEEKLAFWINVHNALVMHAVLAYGIPQNNMKRVLLLFKATYNIGGHIVNADVIQSYILKCRMSRPGQWIRMILSSRTKLRAGDKRQDYAIRHQEPLLHFALSSGCHSDPAVRVYTPKQVSQELETAKQEFIMATFGVGKDKRIRLPKIVESFAKYSRLSESGVVEMIQVYLPETFRKSTKKHHLVKLRKKIKWVPHDFTFRYLISKELVK